MKRCFIAILLLLVGLNVWSQDTEQVTTADTVALETPVAKPPVQTPRTRPAGTRPALNVGPASDTALLIDSIPVPSSVTMPGIELFRGAPDTALWLIHPFFRFTDPLRYSVTIKKWEGKEAIFYSMIALLIFFALIKNTFNRYLEDLFKTYFRTTVNQKQTKEQLLQNPLPSLLLNLFFTLSIGMFLALLLQFFRLGLEFNFWLLYLYCVLALITIYGVKFISLKFFGWVFQMSEATDAYIFVVFATNKIIGIVLLPFLVLLAFTYGLVNEASVSLGIMVVVALIVYRFFLTFVTVHNQIRISFFHFLLYLIAFEIIPVLLINKLLFSFLGETS